MAEDLAVRARTPIEAQAIMPVSESAAMLSVIAAAAKDPAVDVSKMERMMALYTSMQDREAKMAFNEALSRVQAEVPRIVKDRKGGHNKYAALEDIDDRVRPLLIAEGFAVSYTTEPVEREMRITMTLKHQRGHEEKYAIVLPTDKGQGRNEVQSLGSTYSYGRRYLFCGALNIVPVGEDNDGAGGVLAEQERNNIESMIDACEMNAGSTAKFLDFAGANSIDKIKHADYERCMVALKKRLAAKQAGTR